MTALEQMRSLFLLNPRPRNQSRFAEYGLYDAHTGRLVKGAKYPTRSAADAAKTAKGDHALRVRGVPPKPKRKRRAKKADQS